MENVDMMKQMMKQAIGMTDEDFKIFISFPQNRQSGNGTAELMKYKIIAEVTEAKYCTAGLKKGQKFTFKTIPSVLMPEESDCPPCTRALAPLGSMLADLWEKIAKGEIKESRVVECLDPGVTKGGLGHVTFKVYIKKIE